MAQLLVCTVVSLLGIALHACVMTAVVWVVREVTAKAAADAALLPIVVMMAAVSILMLAHVSEVLTWAAAYAIVGAAPPGTDQIYFAFVNYTTLGYGDVLPAEGWRLLGPMTAMNGVLLFGWSTAVIFEVLRRTMVRARMVTPERYG